MRLTLRHTLGVLLVAACGNPGATTTEAVATTDASTTASTTASASTDATTDASATADAPTTGAPDPGEAQCQADLQDCPDGFKCVLRRGAADWEFVCLPVQGDNMVGDACTHDGVLVGTDDCDESSWCIGSFDGSGAPWDGLCYPLCVGDVCEADQRCVGIGALPVCAPVCDPLLAIGCTNAEACIFREPEGFVCFPQGADGAALGEPCETAISCQPGLHCSQRVAGCAAEEFCCTDYCDTTSPDNTCSAKDLGATCVGIGATDPAHAYVGACALPE